MTEEYYLKLTYRSLDNSISEKELEELNQWRKMRSENEDEYQLICLAWKHSDEKTELSEPNLDHEFSELELLMKKEHGKEEKVISISRKEIQKPKINWMAIAASFVLLFGLGTIYKLINKDNLDWLVVDSKNEMLSLVLDDGSTVNLRPNSTFKYPREFGENLREVELIGEAYFEISQNKTKPFVIETGMERVRVLGTSFNVRALKGEEESSVFVKTGKVALESRDGKGIILFAGEKGLFKRNEKLLSKEANVLPNALSWMTKELVFKDTPLDEALKEIQHYYGLQFDLTHLEGMGCPFTAKFKNQEIETVLETLSLTFSIHIEKSSGQFILSKGRCN